MNHGSSRSQNLTLMIFGGLVILCSIFFVLGMVVGRTQVALSADVETVSDAVPEDPDPEPGAEEELTFYESVIGSTPPGLEPALPPFETPGAATDSDSEQASGASDPESNRSSDVGALFLQVTALANADQAIRVRDQLVDRGLPAFTIGPSDDVPLHRVRVGPFPSQAEAASVRRVLEELGFEPIVP